MVATLSMTVQRGIPVNLPHAATALEELHQVVTLTVTKEGKLLFDKEPIASVDEVATRLARWKTTGADVYVVINADRAVEHGRVVDVMDAVRQAGVTRVAVAVRPLSP
jgi:biopolymer transport protein ExbD